MVKYFLLTILLFIFLFISCKQGDAEKDYALLSHLDDWPNQHGFGSPLLDTFERFPDNPAYRGRQGVVERYKGPKIIDDM